MFGGLQPDPLREAPGPSPAAPPLLPKRWRKDTPQPPDGRAPQGLAAWSQKLGERLRPAASTRHEPVQPQGMTGQSPQQGPLESGAQPHGGLGRQRPASSHASMQGLGLSGLGTHSPPCHWPSGVHVPPRAQCCVHLPPREGVPFSVAGAPTDTLLAALSWEWDASQGFLQCGPQGGSSQGGDTIVLLPGEPRSRVSAVGQ